MTQVYRVWLAMQLNPTEAEEFRALVKEARKLGWNDASLGQRIGFDRNPAKRMDQVMKRRRAALGEHLKALREVVSSREDPAGARHVPVGEHRPGPIPTRRPRYEEPVPRLPGEVATARETEPVPDLTAERKEPAVAEDDIIDFLLKVDEMFDWGWGTKDLSQAMGYGESTLSATYSAIEKKPPSRPLLEAVRRFHAEGRRPEKQKVGVRRPGRRPAVPGPAPVRAARSKSAPAASVKEFVAAVQLLQDRGWSHRQIARRLGYANENAVSKVLFNARRGLGVTLPADRLDALRELVAGTSLPSPVEQVPDEAVPVLRARVAPRANVEEPAVPAVQSRRRSDDSMSVLDYLGRAVDALQKARGALGDAEREAKSAAVRGNKWIRAGIESDALPLFAPLCKDVDKLINALTLE